MPRPQTLLEAMTPGQLAKRWGVSVARVRSLVEAGSIPGAFRIPAVGRYGETIKIPHASILQVEEQWAIASQSNEFSLRKRRGRRKTSPPTLEHFPELAANPEPDVASRGGAPY